jgi:hypothetical protein
VKYLRATKDFVLRVKPVNGLQLKASADASWGIYSDGKSQTGLAVQVGERNSSLTVKAKKQDSVANSSTAAEMIALASCVEEILWMREILEELGFHQETIDIEQDNCSAIKLMEKGPTGQGRSKWMNVKAFWITEKLDQGIIRLKYVPTVDIVTDCLTKVTARKAFFRFRSQQLNSEDTRPRDETETHSLLTFYQTV